MENVLITLILVAGAVQIAKYVFEYLIHVQRREITEPAETEHKEEK